MKLIKYLVVGIVFGVVLTKAEVVSWLRIYEMFTFESFHMYGVIGSAVVTGGIMIQIMKRLSVKTIDGAVLELVDKDRSFARYIIGGTFFGFGWAMTGACPGPMFILVGHGYVTMLVAIASATLGTLVYGILKDKLPH